MTEELKRWWLGRTARERTLLSAMFVILALTLGWLLLVRPLTASLEDARARHDLAVLRLAEVRSQAAMIRNLESRRPPALPQPLDVLISRSAGEAGFQPASVVMEAPDRAAFTLQAVRPQALFAWLGQMEALGIVVDRLNATPNADRTIAVQGALRARGR
jgi:general secretion pathway protein M